MSTGSILLAPGAALVPDGSASNAAPAFQRVKSSATAPAPYVLQAAFDQTTREQLLWNWRMPADYGGSPVLKLQCRTALTSGAVVWEGRIAAVTPADAVDVGTKAFGSANTSAATTVPASAGRLFEVSIAMANADSLAAGDLVVLYVARDAAHGSDTAAGDVALVAATLEYTTT